MRRDIADVRLAAQVFAPHYAAPSPRILAADAALREGRAKDSNVLAQLSRGDRFELFEITADDGWGIAIALGLVGYVDAAALTGRTPD